MQWNDWRPLHQRFKLDFGWDLDQALKVMSKSQIDAFAGEFVINQRIVEKEWIAAGRPYYNVHPKFVQVMLNTRLDKMPLAELEVPGELPAVLVRFSGHNRTLNREGQEIRSVLFGTPQTNSQIRVADFFIDTRSDILPHAMQLRLDKGGTIEDALKEATKTIRNELSSSPLSNETMRYWPTIVRADLPFRTEE